MGDDANEYIAAAGHFGNKSEQIVKNYVELLGFEYMSAKNKGEFIECCERFLNVVRYDKPFLFEVFTNDKDEAMANYMSSNLLKDLKGKMKKIVIEKLGSKQIEQVRKIIKG